MADNKDTIYIDIDDEITTIIDKVTSSGSKIVALVLPKRATAMQSLVNMKLLKRASDEAHKNLVLVTSEAGLMPLAGAAGLHVAPTPTSKPSVPSSPDAEEPVEDIDEPDEIVGDFDARGSETKPLGEVAGLAGAAGVAAASEDDPIELDNSEPLATASPKVKKGKNKKLKVPNFKKFRWGVIIALLALVGLGILIYLAVAVWPHATVKIYTNQHQLPLDFSMQLDSGASAVDPATETIPATPESQQKSYSQTVPSTGQKDEGQKASGSITMSICTNDPAAIQDVPAGTGVSTNNLTYITQNDASFSYAGGGNGCFKFNSNSINIVAQQNGDNYNVSGASFAVSGRSDVSASGDARGGTSNIVRVVQQSDIDGAKKKLIDQNGDAIKQQLLAELKQAQLMPLETTFASLPSNVDASANAGDQANNVTVTENVTYVMFGVHKSDLEDLIKANAKQQIDASQGVLETGLDKASFVQDGKPSSTSATLKVSTTAIIGPKLNASKIKQQAEGKKAGDVKTELQNQQGVSKVEVNTSPFWVGSVPKDSSKITVDFVKNSNNK